MRHIKKIQIRKKTLKVSDAGVNKLKKLVAQTCKPKYQHWALGEEYITLIHASTVLTIILLELKSVSLLLFITMEDHS